MFGVSMGNFGKTEALVLVFAVLISLMIFVPTSVKAQTPHDLKNFRGTMDSTFCMEECIHWDQNFDIWINIVDSLGTSPIPTPTIPEFSCLTILLLSFFILSIAIMSKLMGLKE